MVLLLHMASSLSALLWPLLRQREREIMDELLDYQKIREFISIKVATFLGLDIPPRTQTQPIVIPINEELGLDISPPTQTQSIAIPISEEDRFSALPNDLIHHILSLVEAKYAVQTCVLSTRWKHLWKSLPVLNFNSCYFDRSEDFSRFVTQVISHQDNHSLFKLNCTVDNSPSILEGIAHCRASDNLQHLNINSQVRLIIPPSVFTSQSLKHLSIKSHSFIPNLPWNLPALSTLFLAQVCFTNNNHKSLDLFSTLPNLNNLTLVDCYTQGLEVFYITSPQLKKLQMANILHENLCEFIILSPKLSSFTYKGDKLPLISAKDLNCLDEVYIDINIYDTDHLVWEDDFKKNIFRKFINMFTQLGHAKFVTLSLHTIRVLSLIFELLVNQPSPFCKMEHLKIERNHWQRNSACPTAVLTYLCNTSPSCKVINKCSRLKLVTGECYIPNKTDLEPLGHDALFISKEYQTIGVADGGKYARKLLSNVVFSIRNNYQEGENVDMKLVLNEAYLNTKLEGSSTACILTLKSIISHNYLHAMNIGNNGFLVIRDGRIVYRSPKQQQGKLMCQYRLGNSYTYSPISAMELDFPVVVGDIIVVGTDGLFDNAYDYEIEHVVNEMPQHPKVLASLIAQYVLQRAKDYTYSSLLARAAQYVGFRPVGDKYDDITVAVAYVRPADESDDSYVQIADDESNSYIQPAYDESDSDVDSPTDYEFDSYAQQFDLQKTRTDSLVLWW